MVMAAVYGCLNKFDPRTQTWEDYIEVMGHYFRANDITEGEKKRAILLATVGEKTYALIKSLCHPMSPAEKSFKELVKLVQDHRTPKPSEIVQRYKFHTRMRKEGETVQEYVAELRSLSKYCNFGDTLNTMLRDKLVVGVNDDQIQKKLLGETTLAFEKAMSIAIAMETTSKDLQELHKVSQSTPSIAPSGNSVNKMYTKGAWGGSKGQNFFQGKSTQKSKPSSGDKKATRDCFRCGGPHPPFKCPFKNEQCFACKKRGHTKAMCRDRTKSRNCNLVEEENQELEFEEPFHYIRDTKVKPIIVVVEVRRNTTLFKPLKFELDTGCPVTLIDEGTIKEIFGGEIPKLQPSSVRLKSYTGQRVEVSGTVTLETRYNGQERKAEVHVTKGIGPLLLGRDLIKDLSVMTVNRVGEDPLRTLRSGVGKTS